jgi:hypothetical protein
VLRKEDSGHSAAPGSAISSNEVSEVIVPRPLPINVVDTAVNCGNEPSRKHGLGSFVALIESTPAPRVLLSGDGPRAAAVDADRFPNFTLLNSSSMSEEVSAHTTRTHHAHRTHRTPHTPSFEKVSDEISLNAYEGRSARGDYYGPRSGTGPAR